MKNLIKISLILVAMVAFGATSFAQQTATAHVSTNARIITPIDITGVDALEFGDVAVGSTGGTVVISTAGIASTTGDITLPNTGATRSQATFTVTGEANQTYSITLTNATVVITDGTNNMNVSTFVTDPTPTGTLNGSGTQTLNVGGTLTVAGGQAPGTYTNATDLEVTVEYN